MFKHNQVRKAVFFFYREFFWRLCGERIVELIHQNAVAEDQAKNNHLRKIVPRSHIQLGLWALTLDCDTIRHPRENIIDQEKYPHDEHGNWRNSHVQKAQRKQNIAFSIVGYGLEFGLYWHQRITLDKINLQWLHFDERVRVFATSAATSVQDGPLISFWLFFCIVMK